MNRPANIWLDQTRAKRREQRFQVSLLRPATAHQSLSRAGHHTDGHSRTRNAAARRSVSGQSAKAVPYQWLHQLPAPDHGPQTAETGAAAHRLRHRASEVGPAWARLAPDFAPQARCRFNRRNLCVIHNVANRVRPELFLPVGDDVVVLVAGSVVDRSNSDCTASDRNVPQSQFP